MHCTMDSQIATHYNYKRHKLNAQRFCKVLLGDLKYGQPIATFESFPMC